MYYLIILSDIIKYNNVLENLRKDNIEIYKNLFIDDTTK